MIDKDGVLRLGNKMKEIPLKEEDRKIKSYQLTLADEDGVVIEQWKIGTEYEENFFKEGHISEFDDYITEEELQRLGPYKLGRSLAREITLEIAREEKWEVVL